MATITVTTNLDTGDDGTVGADFLADLNDGGGLSLREAIHGANFLGTIDTINFSGPTFAGNAVIRLVEGEIENTRALTIDGASAGGQVVITGDAAGDDIRFAGTQITNVAASGSGRLAPRAAGKRRREPPVAGPAEDAQHDDPRRDLPAVNSRAGSNSAPASVEIRIMNSHSICQILRMAEVRLRVGPAQGRPIAAISATSDVEAARPTRISLRETRRGPRLFPSGNPEHVPVD